MSLTRCFTVTTAFAAANAFYTVLRAWTWFESVEIHWVRLILGTIIVPDRKSARLINVVAQTKLAEGFKRRLDYIGVIT